MTNPPDGFDMTTPPDGFDMTTPPDGFGTVDSTDTSNSAPDAVIDSDEQDALVSSPESDSSSADTNTDGTVDSNTDIADPGTDSTSDSSNAQSARPNQGGMNFPGAQNGNFSTQSEMSSSSSNSTIWGLARYIRGHTRRGTDYSKTIQILKDDRYRARRYRSDCILRNIYKTYIILTFFQYSKLFSFSRKSYTLIINTPSSL